MGFWWFSGDEACETALKEVLVEGEEEEGKQRYLRPGGCGVGVGVVGGGGIHIA